MKSKYVYILSFLFILSSIAFSQILSPKLEMKLKNSDSEEYVRAVIRMKERLDISKLKLLTEGKNKIESRELVVSQVKDFAIKYQKNIIYTLNQSKQKGDVLLIRSIYSTNKIIIKAKKPVYDILKTRTDIKNIYYEEPAFVLCDNTWNVEKINADQVWADIGLNGNGVNVGVIDTGTDYNHSDLHSNIWNNLGEDYDEDGHTLEYNGSNWVLDPGDINGVDDDGNGYVDDLIGYDFHSGDNDPLDGHGHGTHVSGTVVV